MGGATHTLRCETGEVSTGAPRLRAGAGCGAHDWASGPWKTTSCCRGALPTVVRPGPWALGLTAGAQRDRQNRPPAERTAPQRGLEWPHGRWGFEQVTRGQTLGSSPLSPALPRSLTHQTCDTAPWRVPECPRRCGGKGPAPGPDPSLDRVLSSVRPSESPLPACEAPRRLDDPQQTLP